MTQRSLHIEIGWRTFAIAALVAAGVWLLVQIWSIAIVIIAALMIVGAVSPTIAKLETKGLPRSAAITVVFGTMFAVVLGFVSFTVPRIGAELMTMVERVPQMSSDLADFLGKSAATAPLAHSVRDRAADGTQRGLAALIAYTPRVFELVMYAVTTCFLALYLVIDRDRMRGAMFALVPRSFHVRMSRIVIKLETIVGGYLRGQLITSVLMALVTFVVLQVARADDATALAAFAGVADVLPYVGGIVACGPAVVAALAHSTSAGIGVALGLLIYQEFETRILVPRVYGDALRLPPSMVMISLLVGGTLLGIIGALLALPVAAAIRMLVDELEVDLPGEDQAAVVEKGRLSADERAFAKRAAGAPVEKAAAIATEIAADELKAELKAELGEDARITTS